MPRADLPFTKRMTPTHLDEPSDAQLTSSGSKVVFIDKDHSLTKARRKPDTCSAPNVMPEIKPLHMTHGAAVL